MTLSKLFLERIIIWTIEDEIITILETEKNTYSNLADVKLILEDIRRTAEYSSDIAEAALNQTIEEIIELK